MLRSLPRTLRSSYPPRTLSLHPHPRTSSAPLTACLRSLSFPQTRLATTHAISNPTLADIEKRWEAMPPQEQADLWMSLRDRMKGDWHELTVAERKAAFWIAFGPHGPRADYPPGMDWFIFKWTAAAVALGLVIFVIIGQFAREPPKTMNAQWQTMTNEYLKNQKTEPITGISSEGFTGTMVQSKPRKGGIPSEDDE